MLISLGALSGIAAIGYALECAIEIFLPDKYKPFDLVRLKDEEHRAEVRKKKIETLRAARLTPVRLTPIEEMARRLAAIPVTQEDLETAMAEAMEEREARDRGYIAENLSRAQLSQDAIEEFPVGNYEAEDLTEQVEQLAKPKTVVPKRIQRVVINRFPLTENSEYLGGFLKGQAVWGCRQLAKIFLTDTPEFEDALLKAGKNFPTEIFVLRSDGSGIAVPNHKLKYKEAGA